MTFSRKNELAIALDETRDPIARRELLKLMGAAIGLAGLSGCTRAPAQEIIPYVTQPPEVTPGRPHFYATATTLDGFATGVLVESHEGRPTKVEGNPDHPASLGASGAFEQASVLGLYDPHRARSVKRRGMPTTWRAVADALTRGSWMDQQGRGLHLVLEPTSSPTVVALLGELRTRWPGAQVHFHSAANRKNVWEGARLAFGSVLEPRPRARERRRHRGARHRFPRERAGASAPGAAVRGSPSRRRARSDEPLYAIEAVHTVTGAAADHRLAVRASDVEAIAVALLAKVGGAPLRPDVFSRAWSARAARTRASWRPS